MSRSMTNRRRALAEANEAQRAATSCFPVRLSGPEGHPVELASTSHVCRSGGKNMSSLYSVVCASCLYQSAHSSQWEANIDVAAHLRDNPTHSVSIVEESRETTRQKMS